MGSHWRQLPLGGEWECRATVLSEDDDVGDVRRQLGGGEFDAPRVEPADSDQVIQRDACCVRLPAHGHEHGLLERTGCLSNEFDAETSSPKGSGERVRCCLLFWQVEDRYDRSVQRRVTLHGLRHTWATLALSAGIDIKIVSERLNHSSTTITREIYTDVTPPMQSDAAERVAGLIRGT